ncbi:hypothetical protein GH714_011787 [Hevea brasiliensis]|uniref:Uncharacterized protein n=1 Tax=Hevea brasiliensis TaxID=3981 RepID=A0A6A6MNL4_HEVBR|nr:hypothetical protein GH714_011787 [Hevea brasiliensis]
MLGPDLDGDGESDTDDMSNEDDDDSLSELDDEEDGDFIMDDADFDGGPGILEIVTEGDEDDDDSQVVESYSSGEEDDLVERNEITGQIFFDECTDDTKQKDAWRQQLF